MGDSVKSESGSSDDEEYIPPGMWALFSSKL